MQVNPLPPIVPVKEFSALVERPGVPPGVLLDGGVGAAVGGAFGVVVSEVGVPVDSSPEPPLHPTSPTVTSTAAATSGALRTGDDIPNFFILNGRGTDRRGCRPVPHPRC